MVQLSHLRALRAVLDTGSFAAAGQQLVLTPSAVSQQIMALERSLGLTLFERRAQGIRASAAAETLGLRADSVLAQVASLQQEAALLATGARNVVRLGSFPSASARLVPSTLARLSRRPAGMDVLLDEAEPDELLQGVVDGSLDLALVYCYDALPATWPPGVTWVPLVHEALMLLTSAGAPPLAADLSDADTSTWVSSREQTEGWRCLQRLWHIAGVWPRVTHRSNDYTVVRGLVAAGMGAAVIPALAHFDEPAVRGTVVGLEAAGRTIYLTHRDGDAGPMLDPLIRALRQAVRSIASPVLTPL